VRYKDHIEAEIYLFGSEQPETITIGKDEQLEDVIQRLEAQFEELIGY
jgi:hypothetical protein